MRLNRFLNEKYFERIKVGSWGMIRGNRESFEVFINPSKSEMNSVGRESKIKNTLRFTALGRGKKMYIFPSDFFHSDLYDLLRDEYNIDIDEHQKDVFSGVARKVGNKWQVSRSDSSFPERMDYKDWKWVEKWLDIKEWLEYDNLEGFM